MTYSVDYLEEYLSKFQSSLIQRSILLELAPLADEETQTNILTVIKNLDK